MRRRLLHYRLVDRARGGGVEVAMPSPQATKPTDHLLFAPHWDLRRHRLINWAASLERKDLQASHYVRLGTQAHAGGLRHVFADLRHRGVVRKGIYLDQTGSSDAPLQGDVLTYEAQHPFVFAVIVGFCALPESNHDFLLDFPLQTWLTSVEEIAGFKRRMVDLSEIAVRDFDELITARFVAGSSFVEITT